MSAMRQARSGPLRRETIEELPQKFFYLARPQLRMGSLQRGLAVQLGVGPRQEPLDLLRVAPNVLRSGDDAREAFGLLALLRLEVLFPALVGGCGNDSAHDLALLPGAAHDTRRAMPPGRFGKPVG